MTELRHYTVVFVLAVVFIAACVSASLSRARDGGVSQVVGTVVRFIARPTSVDVTIGQDNPAVRDLLSISR